jgi:hypothetical protein
LSALHPKELSAQLTKTQYEKPIPPELLNNLFSEADSENCQLLFALILIQKAATI